MLDLLDGVRVVSFNHFLLGPVGVQLVADLGADVIAVEGVEGGWHRHWSPGDIWHDGQSALFLCGNRNKRSLALDIKSDAGREIALKLIDAADVVAENFRPGVMEKLGLGWEALRARKPSLIYASATGYGATGPYAERPGQDLLVQALFGLMAVTGQEKGPRPVGVSAADHHGAALFALGIVAALFRRARTGAGCRVEANLMQATLDLGAEPLTAWLNAPKKPASVAAPGPIGGWHYPAPYGVYATSDGHLAISLGSLKTLGEALEEPALGSFSEKDSWARRDEIASLITAAVATRPSAEWSRRMEKLKIWHAPVQDYAAVASDPQVRHNGCFITAPGAGPEKAPVTFVGHPLRYDGQTAEVRLAPQPLGAQTEEILAGLGLARSEIDELERAGVIRRAMGEDPR
jgi:crotonobetainyl-CoA:carnitine CoA-transferase CaiB-like acyl-CoA transferase